MASSSVRLVVQSPVPPSCTVIFRTKRTSRFRYCSNGFAGRTLRSASCELRSSVGNSVIAGDAGEGLALEKVGLIFSRGSSSSWDSGGVGGPVVRRYLSDNEERWCMWYHGSTSQLPADAKESSPLPRRNLGCTGLALSRNGIHWSRGGNEVETDAQGEGGAGMVMAPNGNWWTFDTRHVTVSDVLIMSSRKVRAQAGVYWMYYSGGNAEDLELPNGMSPAGEGAWPPAGTVVEGLRMRPGLAMSNDGRNWARIEGEHHSGALFDVGAGGEWDALMVGKPQVVFHEAGDIRMYYYSLDPTSGVSSLGFARSEDGLRWYKFGRILGPGPAGAFDEAGVAACHVIADSDGPEGSYFMVYEGVARDGRRSVGVAHSANGVNGWERRGDGPILSPGADGAWDSFGVASPCLVEMGKSAWRLYYEGWGPGGSTGIGMAEGEGADKGPFTRWQGPVDPM